MCMKKLNIFYEDKDIIVIRKDERVLTVSDGKSFNTLYSEVYDYLHKKNQRVFVVHRLDRDTSGLVLFAKSDRVKSIMQDNWDKVIRKYYAVVCGKLNGEGEVKQYLSEDKTLRVYVSNKGKLAITNYRCLNVSSAYSLMDVLIKTGRRNQIRVCFSSLGHPIIGDKKYGAKKNPIGRLGLHAYYLEFNHPINNKKIVIEDEIPNDFKKIFESATKK